MDSRGCEVVPAGGGEPFFCRVRGRVHRIGSGERSPLAAGDRVDVRRDGAGAVVERVHPRRSRFSREGAEGGRPQVLAANVDLVVALLPAADPPPSHRLADRILAAAADQGVAAAVVVSKVDIAPAGVVDVLDDIYRRAGVPILHTAVPDGRGLDAVGALLLGRTSVLVGPSGAGKSTLLKALLGAGGEGIRIGEVNAKTGKGRHTTTAARLLPFPGGGWVVDTPGVRTLALPEMRPADLAMLFPELRREAPCRFPDCSHLVEPGCVVRRDVEAGAIDRRRYDSYAAAVETMRERARRSGNG